ncbi:MAG: matrixin family metalloprotease, partial [Pseudomonadota bacterium]
LGLEHSSDPNALMFNEYRFPIESLQPDDIAGIQALYGNANGSTPPDEVPPPPVEPPTVSGCGPSGFGDADGDGIDDATEQFWLGTDPFNCDTDGDGLPDSEVFSGLDPRNPDTDFDGVSDGEEVAIGSNPFFPDQGSPTGIVAGYYLGQDSFGSRLEILVSPNGFAEGALTVPGPFGPVSIPLVGGADALGQLSLVSY